MARIPEQATCVFQGEIFSVWQWPQKMYDGTMATFEMIKRPDTVQVLAMDGEDILFSREQQPHETAPRYGIFGGRVDPGEKPLDAAKRELKEEAGLVADSWELLWTEAADGKIDWTFYMFVAKGCQQVSGQKLDAGEQIEILRLPLVQFLEEILPREDFAEVGLQRRLQRQGPDEDRLNELKRKLVG